MEKVLSNIKKYGTNAVLSALFILNSLQLNSERKENSQYIRQLQEGYLKNNMELHSKYSQELAKDKEKYLEFVYETRNSTNKLRETTEELAKEVRRLRGK